MMIWHSRIEPNFEGSMHCKARLPRGAQVLSVGLRQGVMTVWAQVDPTEDVVDIPLIVVPTGVEHAIDGTEHADRFISRVEMASKVLGTLIFHVFTVKDMRH